MWELMPKSQIIFQIKKFHIGEQTFLSGERFGNMKHFDRDNQSTEKVSP